MFQDDSGFQIKVNELLVGLLFAFIWAIFSSRIAWQKKLFAPFSINKTSPIESKNVCIGFGLFLFMQILVIPFLIGQIYLFMTGRTWLPGQLDPIQKTGINLLILIGTYLSLTFYYFKYFNAQQKKAIFGIHGRGFKNYCLGASTWFFIYPVVLSCSLLIDIAILIFFRQEPLEQYAVEQFRLAASHPTLLIGMGLTIPFLVPIAEEFLFRGLLQSWLKKKLNSPLIGIILAAAIFSLFHYSSSQGVTNIQLFISLFLLGCFLGYLYEKYQTIWAPIGLHSMFNAMSAILILMGSE